MNIRFLAFAALAPTVFGAYQPYFTDPLDTLNGSAWISNGGASPAAGAYSNDGSLISRLAIPDGSNEGEVSLNLFFTGPAQSAVIYLRATDHAQLQPTPTGWFHAVEARVLTSNDQFCIAEVRLLRAENGVLTQLFSRVMTCAWQSNLRAVIKNNLFSASLNGVFAGHSTTAANWPANTHPGLSSYGALVTDVALGPLDRTPPAPIGAAAVGATPFPNRIELQWKPPADDQAAPAWNGTTSSACSRACTVEPSCRFLVTRRRCFQEPNTITTFTRSTIISTTRRQPG